MPSERTLTARPSGSDGRTEKARFQIAPVAPSTLATLPPLVCGIWATLADSEKLKRKGGRERVRKGMGIILHGH